MDMLKAILMMATLALTANATAQSLDGCDSLSAEYKIFGVVLAARLSDDNKKAYCEGIRSLIEKVDNIADDTKELREQLEKNEVKSGTIAFFNGECPSVGWREFVAARGRYFVAASKVENVNDIVGTQLTDKENRPAGMHDHALSVGGQHSHTIQNGNKVWQQRIGSTGGWLQGGGLSHTVAISAQPAGAHDHELSPNSGIAGTNSPYILVRACEKTG